MIESVVTTACSSSGGGSDSGSDDATGEGIFNTIWELRVYEGGCLIDGGFFTVDGFGFVLVP